MPSFLAIDPGEISGYVKAFVHAGPHLSIIKAGTWTGIQGLRYTLPPLLDNAPKPEVIITEDYRIYPHAAQTHIGSRVYTAKEIGRIELLASEHNIPLVYQMASQAKQQWPKKRLRRHFPRLPRSSKHTRDALIHLLTYLENQHIMEFFKKEDAI